MCQMCNCFEHQQLSKLQVLKKFIAFMDSIDGYFDSEYIIVKMKYRNCGMDHPNYDLIMEEQGYVKLRIHNMLSELGVTENIPVMFIMMDGTCM